MALKPDYIRDTLRAAHLKEDGSGALGGVVNVITRAPGSERWRLGAMAEGSAAQGSRGSDWVFPPPFVRSCPVL